MANEQVWTTLGPRPVLSGQTFGLPRGAVSGRVSVVVLDPGYDGAANQTVYLGAATGGVWRSRDNGNTWTPLTDDQESLATGAMVIDPRNPNVMYVGTGEGHFSGDSYYGAGVLKSVDSGASWTRYDGPERAFVNATFTALAIDASSPATLYAATAAGSVSSATSFTGEAPVARQGIWKSADAGETWRNVTPAEAGERPEGTDVVVDALDPRRVYAAIWAKGIFRSEQGGEPGTWVKLGGALPEAGYARIRLATGPAMGAPAAVLYAAFATSETPVYGDLLGIYRSTDGGRTWLELSRPQGGSSLNYVLTLAVDPVDPNVVYYGADLNRTLNGGTLWRSVDGGLRWTDISAGEGGGLHADTHWIAISPLNRNVLFTANDGGVWRTDSALAATLRWQNLNETLNITQFYSLAVNPADPESLLGGTQDNGTNLYRGTMAWSHLRDGDGGAVGYDPLDPQVIYMNFFNTNNAFGLRPLIGPYISLNGGMTWAQRGCLGCTARPGNFHPADRVSQIPPMTMEATAVFFGTHRLYRSTDRGVTWLGLGESADGFGADLTKNISGYPDGFPSYLSAIAAHPELVVWTGSGDGLLHVTTGAASGGGAGMVNVTRPPLPNRYVSDIALDAANPRRAVVAFSGFSVSTPDTPGHVFVTTDQGASWTDISGDLPDIPVNSVWIDPLVPASYYAGTDIGVLRTNDGGASWAPAGTGLPRAPVLVLRYQSSTRALVAATHGRGVWRVGLEAR